MYLWKWLLCVAFLSSVVLSDTVPEEIQSENIENGFQRLMESQLKSLKIENTDMAKIFPNHKERLNDVLEQVSLTNTERAKIAIINEYTDECLFYLNTFLMLNSVDPLPLEDVVTGFEFTFLFIKYWAKIGLEDGWLQGVASMQRHADVTLQYEFPLVKIHSPMKFEKLQFTYDYVIKFMGLGPSGGLDGIVDGCRYTFDLTINMTNLRADLDKFNLDTLGKVDLKFNGHIWFDWFVNLCVKFTLIAVKPVLRLVIQGFVRALLYGITGVYNGFMCQILDDCPAELFTGLILNDKLIFAIN